MEVLPVQQEFIYKRSNHSDALLRSLSFLRRNSKFTDFTLSVDEQEIECHKIVLISLIPYFDAMFSSNMSECQSDSMTIRDLDFEAVNDIIDFCYTGEITISQANVKMLLSTSCLFQLHSVRDACCKYLQQQLDIYNCLGIYKFAEKFSCVQLQDASLRFILHNFGHIASTEEFLQLDPETMKFLIQHNELSCGSEEEVYDYVIAWARHDINYREPFLKEVLEGVRFGLMSHEKLSQLSEPNSPVLTIINMPVKNSSSPSPRDPQTLTRKIFVAGGIRAGVHSALNEVMSYNPTEDKWERCAPICYPRFGAGLVARHGYLYMVGGHTGSSYITTVERYDAKSNKWTKLEGLPGPTRRYFSTVALDGGIMMIGGCDGVRDVDTAAVLDIPTKQLVYAGKMNDQRVYCGSCTLHGVVYVAGGYGFSHQYSRLSTAEKYDKSTNTWHKIASMNIARSGVGVVALGNKIYAIGGYDGKTHLNSVEEYNPDSNKWKVLSPMVTPRCAHGCIALNGYIYVFGGFNGKFLDSVERYDPYIKSWETMTPMPESRSYFGSALL